MLCVANMVVSVQWLIYGVLVDDFYMKVCGIARYLITVVIKAAVTTRWKQISSSRKMRCS